MTKVTVGMSQSTLMMTLSHLPKISQILKSNIQTCDNFGSPDNPIPHPPHSKIILNFKISLRFTEPGSVSDNIYSLSLMSNIHTVNFLKF